MQLPNDERPLCPLCEKELATEKRKLAGHTEMMCATCLARRMVREAYEDKLLHITDLERRRQYDEALACLDAILESSRDRDHDGWLARSIADHRALIFFEAGRYAEAEQAYGAWAQLGFGDVSERWMHALGTAHTLEALGRVRDAVSVLEDALGHQNPKYLPSALGLLTELARLSEKLAQPVDSKWQGIAEAVAGSYGIGMSVNDSLGRAILTLEETVQSTQAKRPTDSKSKG